MKKKLIAIEIHNTLFFLSENEAQDIIEELNRKLKDGKK